MEMGMEMDPALVVMVNTIRIHIMIIPIYTLHTLSRLSSPTTITMATPLRIDIKVEMFRLLHPTLPHLPRTPPHRITPQLDIHLQHQVQGITLLLPKHPPRSNRDRHSPQLIIPTSPISTIPNRTPLPPT
jgi:hypothetical protein